jgi:hypothetical protein
MLPDDCDPIKKRQDSYRSAETLIKHKAALLYDTFDDSERTCVRFGMFPAAKMRQLDASRDRLPLYRYRPGTDGTGHGDHHELITM